MKVARGIGVGTDDTSVIVDPEGRCAGRAWEVKGSENAAVVYEPVSLGVGGDSIRVGTHNSSVIVRSQKLQVEMRPWKVEESENTAVVEESVGWDTGGPDVQNAAHDLPAVVHPIWLGVASVTGDVNRCEHSTGVKKPVRGIGTSRQRQSSPRYRSHCY